MKTKLKISNLEVQSFVTSIQPKQINGGAVTTIEECLTGIYQTQDVNACLTGIKTYQKCTLTGNYPTLPIQGCLTSVIDATNNCPTNDSLCSTRQCNN